MNEFGVRIAAQFLCVAAIEALLCLFKDSCFDYIDMLMLVINNKTLPKYSNERVTCLGGLGFVYEGESSTPIYRCKKFRCSYLFTSVCLPTQTNQVE